LSDNRTIGGIVGILGGVTVLSIIFGLALPKICGSKPGGSAYLAFALLSVSAGFIGLATATDSWNTWDKQMNAFNPNDYYYVASPFVLCENKFSESCWYVDTECKVWSDLSLSTKVYDGDSLLSKGQHTGGDQMQIPDCDRNRTVQGFSILACITVSLAWVIGFFVPYKGMFFKRVAAFFAALTVIFGMITTSTWADMFKRGQGWFEVVPDNVNGHPVEGSFTSWEYGFSFAFFIAGWIISIFAVPVLLSVESAEKSYRQPASSKPAQATTASQPAVQLTGVATVETGAEGLDQGHEQASTVTLHQESRA